jgi:hypothetical protein
MSTHTWVRTCLLKRTFGFDDTGIGLANATVTIDLDKKKSKKRLTKEKGPHTYPP